MSSRKVAVVTGGASGIGEASVRRLCADGFSVVINYCSSEAKANALASELSFKGFDVMTAKADVADSAEVNEMIEKVSADFGTPYILVNNSGIAQQKLFTDITDEEWQRMISVNLTGVFNCCRAVLPYMIHEKNGRIINISSMWGQVGASCEVHYSAAKAGVIGLTKALAQEVAPSGITVNCIAPGAVETKMMSSFSKEDIDALCEEIPLMRLGRAEEIASAVSFFACEGAGYITGQILGVNGGMVI
ncbi:MAG: SDR family oxidoreductase [Clostridia bacterium]|nr:SDR family oxidoreductase [Clostridia bacterium]